MTKPKRWLDDQELSELEKGVLTSALDDAPPAAAEPSGWNRLALAVVPPVLAAAPAGAGMGTVAGSMVASTTLLGSIKLLVVGFGFGVVVTAGADLTWEALSRSSVAPEAVPSRASPPDAQTSGPTATAPTVPSAEPSPGPRARRVVVPPPTPEESVARFEPVPGPRASAEADLVRHAREHLRRKEHGAAFALLEAARALYPNGTLLQEREALTIELLFATGQRGAALARANAFVAAHPASPHTPRVRRFIEAD